MRTQNSTMARCYRFPKAFCAHHSVSEKLWHGRPYLKGRSLLGMEQGPSCFYVSFALHRSILNNWDMCLHVYVEPVTLAALGCAAILKCSSGGLKRLVASPEPSTPLAGELPTPPFGIRQSTMSHLEHQTDKGVDQGLLNSSLGCMISGSRFRWFMMELNFFQKSIGYCTRGSSVSFGGWHQVQDISERQACFPESVVSYRFSQKPQELLFDW